MNPGTVYLVGAGPGDPELLTLKGRRILAMADAVVYDQLVDPELLGFTRPGCVRVFAGKRGGQACRPQHDIEETLVRLALEGKTVVRLKGGDPFIFGRGGEEIAALAAAGIPYQVVPGVTSALAAAAYSAIPLTHRVHSSAVILLTGHEDPLKADSSVRWEDYARLGATLCVYMGVRNLQTIAERLQAGGMSPTTPAALVQSATTAEHRRFLGTIATIADIGDRENVQSPAMLIVGEVAAFSETLAWFEAPRQQLAER